MKKFMLMVLVAAMALPFVGCSKEEAAPAPAANAANAAGDKPADKPAEKPAEAAK